MKSQLSNLIKRRGTSVPSWVRGFAAALATALSTLAWERALAETVYVSSVNGNKVYRIATNGTVTAFATINLLPEGLAFGTNGMLHVANDGGNWINRVTPSGATSVFVTNVAQPYGLAFDSKGNLYAASQSSPSNPTGRVRKITPQGVVTNFGPTINAPYGLAIDAGDNVLVSSGYSYIYKITPSGSSSMFGFVNGATGLALDKAGNLYVADNSGTITRITPAGGASTFATGLGHLVGLAFDNLGNLYAADYLLGAVSKVSPDQKVTPFATVPGNPSFIAVFPPPKFEPGPISIAQFDSDLVVSWFGNFVLESATTATGSFSDIVGATSPYTNLNSSAAAAFFRLRN